MFTQQKDMDIDLEKLRKELLALKEMNEVWEKRQNALKSAHSKNKKEGPVSGEKENKDSSSEENKSE